MAGIFKNVAMLDTGARGSMTTFLERNIGDVLIAWENEALLAARQLRPGSVEVVVPSLSILAEPPVAVVDKVVDRHRTRAAAEHYIEFLYTNKAQEIAAKHHYRPRNEAIAAEHAAEFPKVELFTIDELFGGWAKAHKDHFADGGTFDQIMQTK